MFDRCQAGNVASAIVREAKRSKADIIVLGIRGAPALATHFTRDIVHQVVCSASCAVLAVRIDSHEQEKVL